VTTSAALATSLDPRSRAAIVRRREAVLDELERRDPAGFARWLASGPLSATDPSRFLRADAAGTDAA
jgi:antibiotic biosynthesis monooxygenase (ABM) superfamily enzyme